MNIKIKNYSISNSTKMAVISVFFMFLTITILTNQKIALIISLIGWFGSTVCSVVMKLREKKVQNEIK